MGDNSKILQFKNQKLREQVEVHKREKASLEEKVMPRLAQPFPKSPGTALYSRRDISALARSEIVLAAKV